MKINFFSPNKVIHHSTACLIQGLLDLGHEIAININPQFVQSNGIYKPFYNAKQIPGVTITNNLSEGMLVADISNGIGEFQSKLLDSAKKNPIVLINMHDGANWYDYEPEFLVFTGHFNKYAKRKGRIYPLGFGVSQEAIQNVKGPIVKTGMFLRNFRPSNHQSVRNALDLILIPKLEKLGPITQNITTHQEYEEDLKGHRIVLSYCGDFYKDLRKNPYFLSHENSQMINFEKIIDDPVILRFDSWRFYEAALFQACPMGLNFEKYGLDNGANPKEWQEYIPINLDEIDETVDRLGFYLKNDVTKINEIGERAQQWVIREHSPIAIATRFIQRCAQEKII